MSLHILKYLVIHCTATIAGREVSKEELISWHTAPPPLGRGWSKVGYSDLIHLDGTIENLIPYDEDNIVDPFEISNGAKGINYCSRHIAYVGGINPNNGHASDTRTKKQIQALTNYLKTFHTIHPETQIFGHYHFAPKACPSFNVKKFLLSINLKQFYK